MGLALPRVEARVANVFGGLIRAGSADSTAKLFQHLEWSNVYNRVDIAITITDHAVGGISNNDRA